MIYHSDTKTLRKENQRLLRNVKRRLANITRKYGSSYATQRFLSLEIPMTTRGLTDEELRKQYSALKYIDSMKTSRIKGMRNFEKFNKIIDSLNAAGEGFVDKFYSLYGRLVEENGLLEKYKYQVMDTIRDGILNADNDEVIRNNVLKLFDDIYRQEQINIEDEITF